jgi:nanoRNase/pAp phosphatase (c-di-AMP/oligoRNAs hydrolase)
MIDARESEKNLAGLLAAVRDTDSLLILTHNNPDPDAIASAVALNFLLANKLGVESHIAYEGIIGRAENKALVRCLGHSLRQRASLKLDKTLPTAFVDTQPGAGNNAPPAGSVLAIVIDHHPQKEATSLAKFAHIQVEVGATSTILTEYLQAAGLEPTPLLATALFYGVKTDTRGLGRTNASPADVSAYAYLQSRLDVEILAEIEQAQVPADYFQGFDAALRAAHAYDGIVVAYVGHMKYPDLAAEAADFLLRLEGAQWVICTGAYKETMNLSVRTRKWQGGAGQLAQAIVGRDGVAGGHGVMAGGQIPLKGRDPAQLTQQLGQRALQHLRVSPDVVGRPLI